MLKHKIAGVVLTVASTLSVAAFAVQPAAAATCTRTVSTPWKTGNSIAAGGNVSTGCSGNYAINLWRSRWYGWEGLASSTVFTSGGGSALLYNCTGTGTHTYKASINGGGYPQKDSGEFRVSC